MPRGYHREDIVILIDHALDQHRSAKSKGFLKSRRELLTGGDADRTAAECLCNGAVIHLVLQDRLGIPSSIEQLLPLVHHPQDRVVEHHLNDADIVPACGRQLIHVHPETAVPGNVHDNLVRQRRLHADGCSQAVAHRAEAAGSKQLPGLLIAIILCRPHLVLSHFRDDLCISLRQPVDLLHDEGAGQPSFIIPERIQPCQLHALLYPLLMILRADQRIEALEHFIAVSGNAHIHLDILVDLSRVDIDLNDPGLLRKGTRVADDPVREPAAHRNQQVAVGYRQVRRLRAVHPQHAKIQRVIAVKRALSHQRITDRRVQVVRQLLQLL